MDVPRKHKEKPILISSDILLHRYLPLIVSLVLLGLENSILRKASNFCEKLWERSFTVNSTANTQKHMTLKGIH